MEGGGAVKFKRGIRARGETQMKGLKREGKVEEKRLSIKT